jgi:UDP-galactopyranose mutase
MPKNGYSKMFEKMLNNKNIRLMLCTDYKDIISDIDYKKIFVT